MRFWLYIEDAGYWWYGQVGHQHCLTSIATATVNARYNLEKSFLKKMYCAVRFLSLPSVSVCLSACLPLFLTASYSLCTLKFTILLVVLVVVSSGFSNQTPEEKHQWKTFFCRFRLFSPFLSCCSLNRAL